MNPCDYSRLSEDSAQEATLIRDSAPSHNQRKPPAAVKNTTDQRTGAQKSETMKSKLFANMFIGQNISKTHVKPN